MSRLILIIVVVNFSFSEETTNETESVDKNSLMIVPIERSGTFKIWMVSFNEFKES